MGMFDWLRGQASALEHRLTQAEELGERIDAKLDGMVEQASKWDNAIASLYERALKLEDRDVGPDAQRVLGLGERIDNAATEFSKAVDGLMKEDGRVWKAIERIEKRTNERLQNLARAVDELEKDADEPSKKK